MEHRKTLALCAGVFVLAFGVRAWTNTWLTDFWGDSYHHWLITRLTMLNGGVYSDYKGLEVVWSPLYHYVSMIPFLIAGRGDMFLLHWMNTLFGAVSCALSAYLAWRLYANRVAAFTAGAVLALMTWHVAFSGMNVAEVFSGMLVLGVVVVVLARRDEIASVKRQTSSVKRQFILFLFALAMPLTRTDLSVYLAIIVVWLMIQKRYVEAMIISGGVVIALSGWSAWSFFKTGNVLHWYQQYTQNNLHDWFLLNEQTPNAAFTFAEYLNRLSPFVLPALIGGALCAVTVRGARRKNVWLVTALLAGHSLFLIVGYARGIVPLLTERYLAMDLPLVAVLMGGWVILLSNGRLVGWSVRWWDSRMVGQSVGQIKNHPSKIINYIVALILISITILQFRNDIPELEIRRWAIDPEWQVGKFLDAQVQAGDVVLTDAPVAIYRSGKNLEQFVSSVELEKLGEPRAALREKNVRWIVTQPVSYDAASNFVPRELLEKQMSGTMDGLRFELVWRYDPQKTDIQSEVWHVIKASR